MKYAMNMVFTDDDADLDWEGQLKKLQSILRHFKEIHPRFAEWYALKGSPEESLACDLMGDPATLAATFSREKQGNVGYSVLFWNGKWSGDLNVESEDYPEWVDGKYFSGGGNQKLFKHLINLELHPLPTAPQVQIEGFVSLLRAVLSERSVTWGVLSTPHYMMNSRVFPHRRWGGWMVYLPQRILHQEIPQAAEVIDIDGKGTVILSTREPFDDTNPEHVKRANEVEIRLVELELLPELHG